MQPVVALFGHIGVDFQYKYYNVDKLTASMQLDDSVRKYLGRYM